MNESLRSQLEAIRTIRPSLIRPGRPSVKLTYQLSATLHENNSRNTDLFARAVRSVLDWLKGKFPMPLPDAAWGGAGFTKEMPGHKAEVVSIPSENLWSFRYEHPDMNYLGKGGVAGRVWTVNVAFLKKGNGVNVGVRVFCSSPPSCNEPIILTRPRLVSELAKVGNLRDVFPLDGRPHSLNTREDLDKFYVFLTSKERNLPVVVLSQRRPSPETTQGYVLDHIQLAQKCLGVAHVMLMPWELGYEWTARVGKPWSVYLGAARTYMPELDFATGSPASHPRIMAENILSWKYENIIGEAAFSAYLTEKLMITVAIRRMDWGGLYFVADARVKENELASQRMEEEFNAAILPHKDEALQLREQLLRSKKVYADEIQSLRQKLEETEKEAEEFNDDSIQATKERDYYKEENFQIKKQLQALRMAFTEKSGAPFDEKLPIPETYDEMENWAQQLVGRLVLHHRAYRGLKDAKFENVALVYKALILLANEYRDMRIGQCEKEAFEEALKNLKLRLSGSIDEARAGAEGDDYYVTWPIEKQTKRFFEFHLRQGTSRDPRHCFALYFFWDDESEQVVVGWLPSHLDNRLT